MTIEVSIPVRVRVPPQCTPDELADLEVAVGDAAHRAMLTCQRRIATPLAGRATLVLQPPSITFRADTGYLGPTDVLERAITEGIGYAARRLGDASSNARRPVADDMGGSRSEPLDESRLDPEGRTYRVAFYDNGTDRPVTVDRSPRHDAPPAPRRAAIAAPDDYPTPRQAAHLAREAVGETPSAYAYYGTVVVNRRYLTGLFLFRDAPLRVRRASVTLTRIVYEDGADASTLQWGARATVGARAQLRHGHSWTREGLTDMAADISPPRGVPPAEWRRQLVNALLQIPAGAVWILDYAQSSLPLTVPPDFVTEFGDALPIPIVAGPVRDPAGSSSDASPGTTRADRDDEAPSPLQSDCIPVRSGREALEHGETWPQTDLDGRRLVCEPWDREPPLFDLIATEPLADDLREFASAAGIPYCGYPGRFCLNAFLHIAAQARDAGVGAVESDTRTAVRMEASGEVSIAARPQSSLARLKELARLAARLYRLAQRVSAAASETEKGCDYDGTSWSIGFLATMGDLAERAFERIYAETARAVLLQQLRSSKDFIDARRSEDGFERMLETFRRTLGVFGDDTARLRLLKRALAYNRDPYVLRAQDFEIGGSSRAVRYQTTKLASGDYIGQAIDDSPYRGQARERIAGPLQEAPTRRRPDGYEIQYEGVWLDDAAIDARIQRLRQVVNTVDPLFLQVEHFESLHTRYRNDPESLDQFMTSKLAEMAEANEEITKEASERDDGAWFAVATTQYARTDRGWDERGLRYRLHGIHLLADNELESEVGSLPPYIWGVNRAIGREEGNDLLLGLGITAGMIALAVFCAPLGVVAAGAITGTAGLATTLAIDYAEAVETEQTYRALRNPEAIMSWADVEIAYLFAYLGLAFSAFDVIPVGRGVRATLAAGRRGMREAMDRGVRDATGDALRRAMREVSEDMTERMMRELASQAATAAAIETAMRVVVPQLIGPALARYIDEVNAEHGTGGPQAPTPGEAEGPQ